MRPENTDSFMKNLHRIIILPLLACSAVSISQTWAQEEDSIRAAGGRRIFTLDEMFALAEDNEARLKISRSAAEIASMKVKESMDDRLPDISATVSASYIGDGVMTDRDFTNAVNAPMPHFGNNFAFEATQVLYAGGALKAAVEMASIEEEIAGKETELTRQQVRLVLAGYYLDLFRMRNQSVVYRSNCNLMERLVELGKSKESHGTALRNDVTRYELQLAEMRLALDNVETEASVLNYRLCTMVGLDPDVEIEVDTSMISGTLSCGMEEEWLSLAESAPSVSIALSGREMAETGLKLARAEMIPKIALTAADRLDGPVLIEVPPLNSNFNYWYVGIGVNIDFGALYKSSSKVRQARTGIVRSGQELELARREAAMEIQAAYRRYVHSFTELDTQMKNVELAAENYRIIRNRYENGLSIVTDMVDASNMKLSAELAEVNAWIGLIYSHCRLRYAAGIL